MTQLMRFLEMPVLAGKNIVFVYKNHENVVEVRSVSPRRVFFGTTPYYTQPCWLLEAFCNNRKANRIFKLENIEVIGASRR